MVPILMGMITFLVMWAVNAPIYLAFGFGMVITFLVIIDNTLESLRR